MLGQLLPLGLEKTCPGPVTQPRLLAVRSITPCVNSVPLMTLKLDSIDTSLGAGVNVSVGLVQTPVML